MCGSSSLYNLFRTELEGKESRDVGGLRFRVSHREMGSDGSLSIEEAKFVGVGCEEPVEKRRETCRNLEGVGFRVQGSGFGFLGRARI